jgi:hypothetical protein
MTNGGHLSDLEIDRLRIERREGKPDSERWGHIQQCPACRLRMEQMEQLSREVQPELAAALARAEQVAGSRSRSGGKWRLPAIAAATACALAVLITIWLLPATTDISQDTVQVKGAPRLEVWTPGGKQAGEQLVIGRQVQVRLSGTPPPRSLVVKEAGGNIKVLWPLGKEAPARGGQIVELGLEVEEPPGELRLYALFGPARLSEQEALGLARRLEAKGTHPPEGWQAVQRTFQVVSGK